MYVYEALTIFNVCLLACAKVSRYFFQNVVGGIDSNSSHYMAYGGFHML